ncbi:MAG TPA: HEAT repeat domain-containing protein [Solirubrobacter sp.]|nr:HEAT repeat domain-containing protein [Solirubrobacter sp.]
MRRRRPSATDRLLHVQAERDPGALLAAASDTSLDVARRALRRLATLGGEPERAALADAVWTCDDALAGDVATTLRALGDQDTLDAATAHLRSGPAATRCRAARVLQRLGDARARPALHAALRNHDASVRGAAADALGALGRASTTVAALAPLVGDRDADVRRRAVRALGRVCEQPGPLVAGAAGDPAVGVRLEAARLAARLPQPAVERLLADHDIEVRRIAAGHAGRGSEALLAATLAGDPQVPVRFAAAERLGELATPPAARALHAAALDDPDAIVRAKAISGLQDLLGTIKLAAEITHDLTAPSPHRRAMALRTLARLVVKAEAARTGRPMEAAAHAGTLRLGAAEAERLAHDPAREVRQALAEVVYDVAHDPARAADVLASDPEPTIRHAATLRRPAPATGSRASASPPARRAHPAPPRR